MGRCVLGKGGVVTIAKVKPNVFQLVIAVLNVCAAGQYAYRGQWKLCSLMVCYAVASGIIAFMKD